MFDPDMDPLGQAVRQRAADARWKTLLQRPAGSPIGTVLPDPQWEGYMQAVQESNPGKSVHFGGGGALPDDDGQPGTPPLALQGLMGAMRGRVNKPKPLEVQA